MNRRSNIQKIRDRIREVVHQEQDALQRLEDLVSLEQPDANDIGAVESELERLNARSAALIEELNLSALGGPQFRGRRRVRQRPFREIVLDLLDELGIPSPPRVVSEYAVARLGAPLP